MRRQQKIHDLQCRFYTVVHKERKRKAKSTRLGQLRGHSYSKLALKYFLGMYVVFDEYKRVEINM